MKKGLKKIKLVSKVPKVDRPKNEEEHKKDVYEPHITPEVIDKLVYKSVEFSENSADYYYMKDAIRDMFYNIINCKGSDIEKLNLSLEVNGFIKEYKFDKNYHKKIREDLRPLFYPILNASSNYMSKFFIKSLPTLIEEVVAESPESFECYKKYILNELHNLINYRKTSIILLAKTDFDMLHDMFMRIKEEFSEQFILGKSRHYTKSNFNLDPFEILDENETYKVIYVIPTVTYGDVEYKLSKNNPRGIMAPVIFNKNGEPESLKLWDSIAIINKKYNIKIPVKCLVPINVFLNNENKVIKMSNKVLINCFNSLSCFKEKLNRKISLLLFSVTETYYSRRYL